MTKTKKEKHMNGFLKWVSIFSAIIVAFLLGVAMWRNANTTDQIKAQNLDAAIQMVGKETKDSCSGGQKAIVAQDIAGHWYIACGN